jgi:hypothetical protein
MYNDHINDVNYSHPFREDLADNELSPLSAFMSEDEPSPVNKPQEQGFRDDVDPATQRIFQFVYNTLQAQEDEGRVTGLTYEQIQDGTTYGYSFIKSRMPEILKTDQIMVEPGSGRRPSRFFLPHQYEARQAKQENDSIQSVNRFEENEDYDDEQAARKTVLASMKRKHETLLKQLEEIQSEIKKRESAIEILEGDIRTSSNL